MDRALYKSLKEEIAIYQARLVAVSKTQSVAAIRELYDEGQRLFGENKVQEMVEKYTQLPSDIEWHLIGHLQTNKVKYIAPFVSMIQSVDSLKLLQEINKQASKQQRIIDCLLQVYIAAEDTKFGWSEEELIAFFESSAFDSLPNVRICGLMGMATNTEDVNQIENEFARLHHLMREAKNKYFAEQPYFKELSMGMSSDYSIALRQGSTLVRIGSLIFGERH